MAIKKLCLHLCFTTIKLRHYLLSHVVYVIAQTIVLKYTLSRSILQGIIRVVNGRIRIRYKHNQLVFVYLIKYQIDLNILQIFTKNNKDLGIIEIEDN